jgi:AraC-like DNA-binding protein
MWTTTELFRILASVQLVALGVVILRDFREDRSARASLAFIAACVAHILYPLIEARKTGYPWSDLGLFSTLAVPLGFWVLVEVHFVDEYRVRLLHGLGLAMVVGASYLSWLFANGRLFGWATDAGSAPFWLALPRLLAAAVIIHALLVVYVGARSDLIVARIRLRYIVLLVTGSYLLVESLAEALFRGTPAEATVDRVHAASVWLLVFTILVLCVRLRPEVLRPAPAAVPGPALDPRLAENIERLIEQEQAFRQEGLTITALAGRLAAPEHKVRQLINSQLGFKNFNAFVNHYRVREARQILADPTRLHLGVAEVAYQVGFRSLGPFNKAFKELSGLTPTEYRASQRLRDAERVGASSPAIPAEPAV